MTLFEISKKIQLAFESGFIAKFPTGDTPYAEYPDVGLGTIVSKIGKVLKWKTKQKGS